MRKALVALLAATLVSLVLVGGASGSRGMLKGFYDEGLTLGYPDNYGFKVLKDLKAQVLRVNLYWNRVATSRPTNPSDPADSAYDWSAYDTLVQRANAVNVKLVFSVFATPGWANGGKAFQYAPNDIGDLQAFSEAAARRFPSVKLWLAWNEPNAPNFLKPQSEVEGGVRVFTSPRIYAQICNAVTDGVRAGGNGTTVGCGVLNPSGKLRPTGGPRESVAPIVFLEGMKRAGARVSVVAVNPYPASPSLAPNEAPNSPTFITLGNIGKLISTVDRLWGKRPIWVTEYGYQTNPPDRQFGVSWATQAKYLTQAFAIARKNPRIGMFLWFQLKDEPRLAGWQAGVISTTNKKKPSYNAFKRLPR